MKLWSFFKCRTALKCSLPHISPFPSAILFKNMNNILKTSQIWPWTKTISFSANNLSATSTTNTSCWSPSNTVPSHLRSPFAPQPNTSVSHDKQKNQPFVGTSWNNGSKSKCYLPGGKFLCCLSSYGAGIRSLE